MATIKAVLFDYGMVLSGPPDPVAWERMMKVFEAESAAFHKAYWKFRDGYDRGALSGDRYWQAVAEELQFNLEAKQLQELLEADTALWTAPNESMIQWAAKLQQTGIKTGVLSNIGDAMEAGIAAKFAWLADFSHQTFSHRLGIAKPDAEIYRHAAEGLGVEPAEILFIDDREENIAAARAAGMQAVQYGGHEEFLEQMKEEGFGWLINPEAKS